MDQKAEEPRNKRDWRNDVQLDTNELMVKIIDAFNTQYGKSFKRCPLIEFQPSVTEHYILALMQIFAHLFTGFAGCDVEIERKFMADLAEFFKAARMEQLKMTPGGAPLQ